MGGQEVVPFLKVDKGLADEADGAQVMKPMPDLDALLDRAQGHGVFGTKMRSVIKLANPAGIDAVVGQQFERRPPDPRRGPRADHRARGRHPQPARRRAAEELLKAALLDELDGLTDDQHVMLKLTLPEQDDFYADLVAHPRVLRVVALSGGYTRAEADAKLARNHGVIASFSRALTEGLSAQQTDGRVRRDARCLDREHLRGVDHLTARPSYAADHPGGTAPTREAPSWARIRA